MPAPRQEYRHSKTATKKKYQIRIRRTISDRPCKQQHPQQTNIMLMSRAHAACNAIARKCGARLTATRMAPEIGPFEAIGTWPGGTICSRMHSSPPARANLEAATKRKCLIQIYRRHCCKTCRNSHLYRINASESNSTRHSSSNILAATTERDIYDASASLS